MAANRILYVNQEIAPYLPSNPLSDLGRALPQSVHGKGCEVRTFMPKYGSVNERRNQLHEVIRLSGVNIVINDTDHPLIIKVASMHPSRIQVYFIDNDDYFQKSNDDVDAYGSNRSDNDERNIFFARGTMETVRKLRWEPGIIHCSGLVTSLLPLYLRLNADDPAFKDSKIIYSVLPGELKAPLDPKILDKLAADGFPAEQINKFKKVPADSVLLHLLAIEYADGIIFHTEKPDPTLLKRIEKLKKPYIMAPAELDPSVYKDFYESINK